MKLGFTYCGIARSEKLEAQKEKLSGWLQNGFHGQMNYLAKHFEKRLDPGKLVPGAKSVVCLAYNYFPEKELDTIDNYKIAKYSYGKDYHKVIKKKLKKLISILEEEIGAVHGRAFVDSAPVMERQWAARAGLGWIGKNGLLLNKQSGSFLFLAELIIDVDLDYDTPVTDHCGSCTKCLDACPTQAFPQAGVLNATKCISYLTIELRESIPSIFRGKMQDWIFGCDVCQDVCPWNRFAKPHKELAFNPSEELQKMRKSDWEEITKEVFNVVFEGSALQRTKHEGLKRNIQFNKKPR